MLSFEKITKKYGEFEALRELSFSLEGNQVVGLLGPNGAGKSTCMKILSGAISSSHGQYLFQDKKIDSKMDHNWKRRVGFLPERPPVYEDLSVRDNLRFWAEVKSLEKNEIDKEIERVVGRCGLNEVLGRRGEILSKGYRQRLGIATALIGNPDVLILDEPVSGLDPKQMIEIRSLVKELGQDHLVIFSSHQLYEVEQICASFIFLNKGKLIASGSKSEIQPKMSLPLLKVVFFEAPAELPIDQDWTLTEAGEFHISIEKSRENAQRLLKAFEEKSLVVLRFEWEEQNLESLFLKLVTDEVDL